MASALSDHSIDMNSDSIEDVSATMNDENSLQNDYEPLFEVEEDEDCGRYLIADQKISQGQIILFEKPTGIYLFSNSIFCIKYVLPSCNNFYCHGSNNVFMF